MIFLIKFTTSRRGLLHHTSILYKHFFGTYILKSIHLLKPFRQRCN